ncbi:LLM class flavin-dependent oxidoreductase [Dictyobacter formicarum]|uniref:Uncharacterized protein n=1 Tax=Dictyobacter formicarum TaxID=2778368 RepID=A0ABQ3VVN2_9CHLR|nr:LLM class flavin-dependent oxidoreductase [Dictyobacter formicarum]GHO89694.1 hypothetical protein KSZ_77000 [Dictyobacter formicarum]
MNMLLENKSAVIYGAGGAVGGAIARAFGLIGTPETIRERLAAYEAAGVQELVIHFSDATHLETVRQFGQTFIM